MSGLTVSVTEVLTVNNDGDDCCVFALTLELPAGGETPLSFIDGNSGIDGKDSGEKAAWRAALEDESGCLHV